MKWLLIGLLALTFAAPAQAVDLRWTDGQPAEPFQRLAGRALAPTPPVQVTVHWQDCPDMPGRNCTYNAKPYEIWLQPAAGRGDLYHELGHVFDYTVMDDGARKTFQTIMRLTGPWRQPANSPHEQFAEAYRMCARYRTLPHNRITGFGYDPSPRQQRRVCGLIDRQSRR